MYPAGALALDAHTIDRPFVLAPYTYSDIRIFLHAYDRP